MVLREAPHVKSLRGGSAAGVGVPLTGVKHGIGWESGAQARKCWGLREALPLWPRKTGFGPHNSFHVGLGHLISGKCYAS